jgi:aminoglycoside phosphotransferase (APT) family kinase protein
LPGEDAASARLDDPSEAARTLARFLSALQQIDTTGGPPAGDHNVRGQPLLERDAATRKAIVALDGLIDGAVAVGAWEAALAAPDWSSASVWFHGDLLPGNVLVEDGRLRAVIDWSGLAVGDPACDLMMAWGLFSGDSRAAFRDALGIDDATWARARGHALSQAAIFIPYYLTTNPVGVRNARRMLDAVLADG